MHETNRAGLILFIIVVVIAGGIVAFALTHRTAIAPSLPATSTSTSTSTAAPATPPASTGTTSDANWMQGFTVVTSADNGKTIALALNERFVIQLGDSLKWTLTFSPAGGISRVANSTTANGVQGVYEADKAGTYTLSAVGKPDCKPGMMCAQYLVETNVTFVVR